MTLILFVFISIIQCVIACILELVLLVLKVKYDSEDLDLEKLIRAMFIGLVPFLGFFYILDTFCNIFYIIYIGIFKSKVDSLSSIITEYIRNSEKNDRV